MIIKNFISLLDEPNVAAKKIKSAVTDSDGIIKFDKDKNQEFLTYLQFIQV